MEHADIGNRAAHAIQHNTRNAVAFAGCRNGANTHLPSHNTPPLPVFFSVSLLTHSVWGSIVVTVQRVREG